MNNKDRNRILGPVMIPDFKILRHHDEIGFYHLVFSVSDIEHCKDKFHKEKKEKNVNINHQPGIYSGAHLTESFLISVCLLT